MAKKKATGTTPGKDKKNDLVSFMRTDVDKMVTVRRQIADRWSAKGLGQIMVVKVEPEKPVEKKDDDTEAEKSGESIL